MQNLTLTLDESIYQKVLDFLDALPKNLVTIDSTDDKIDLGQFKIQGLKNIQDPIAWQQEQRDEWQ
ncbi:hypothetical protein [Moraxella boevrei]|uniref:hypothetical protein n=1 Tax=Faucicola boevrei TaxID=346665 RepID=UPI0037356562